METRANHLLIGSFVLLFMAGIFGFVVWVAKVQIDKEFAYFDILFSDSVAGLGVGGDVRFNGIKVGTVDRIRIDPQDTARVKVTVAIASDTPVRADSFAQLELQGITGVSYVQITGGNTQSSLVQGGQGTDNPLIRSRPSKIAELFQGVPDLLARSLALVDKANELLGGENQRNIGQVLADFKTVTSAVASREQAIGRIIDSLDKTSADVAGGARALREMGDQFKTLSAQASRTLDETEKTITAARGTLGGFDRMMSSDVKAVLADTRQTAAALSRLAEEVQQLVNENREPLRELSKDGFGEFRQFLNEARILVGSLSRVAARLEDDPSQVLFGSKDSEYKAEKRQ